MSHRKVIIIGSGPAGATAALYTARAGLEPLVIGGSSFGGQLLGTDRVDNWPGRDAISGPDLMQELILHSQKHGAAYRSARIKNIDLSERPFTLTLTDNTTCTADSVIIACGATPRRLHCPGEETYWGKGVTTCATCDAPFYKDKEVVIVGGGNTAVVHALQLVRIGARVTIVHILDTLTATDPTVNLVHDNKNISIIYSHTVAEIHGDGTHVTGVTIQSQQNNDTFELKTSAVFIAIGVGPNTDLFTDQLDMDKNGYILRDAHRTTTSVDGVFAAGDVADRIYHQAITAAGEGCRAALDCEYFLTGSVKVVYSQ